MLRACCLRTSAARSRARRAAQLRSEGRAISPLARATRPLYDCVPRGWFAQGLRRRSPELHPSQLSPLTKESPSMAIQIDQAAPDFELPSNQLADGRPGKKIKLSDYRGKPVVLAFYPLDFS